MTHVSEYLTATKQFVGDGEYWLFLPMAGAIELEKRLGIDDREGRRQPKSLCMIYGQLAGSFSSMRASSSCSTGAMFTPARSMRSCAPASSAAIAAPTWAKARR